MELIDKGILFDRNEDGKLIPKEVAILGSDNLKSVKILPLKRGEIFEHVKINEDGQFSEESVKWIILNKIAEPQYTEDDFEYMPKGVSDMLVITVCQASGMIPNKQSLGIKGDDTKKSMPSSEIVKNGVLQDSSTVKDTLLVL